MIIEPTTNNHVAKIPEDIIERREMVTGIILFDQRNGILTSQRPKYERQKWAYVTSLLPGNDAIDMTMTCEKMSQILERYNIYFSPYSLKQIIKDMKRPRYSIRRDVRKIGVSCKVTLEAFGGIKEIDTPSSLSGLDHDSKAYYLGLPQKEVTRLKRALQLIIQINP